MKRSILLLSSIFMLFTFIIMDTSCSDDEDLTDVPEAQDTTKVVMNEESSEDAAFVTDIYMDAIGDVLVGSDENTSKNVSSTCAEVTIEPDDLLSYPKTLTIDYGTDGCDMNGHTVKGTITAEISGRLRADGTTISVSFDSFSVDTVTVNGTIALSVQAFSTQNIELEAAFTNCSVVMPSGTISLDGTVGLIWEFNTLTDYNDDMLSLKSGSLTATNRSGKSFTIAILEDLLYPVSCRTIVSGQMKVETSDNNFPATVDFGDGTCDNIATVTTTVQLEIGNQTIEESYTYEITLP